jgi:maltose alpha-D-glucosyltransferase/alpha-amylase
MESLRQAATIGNSNPQSGAGATAFEAASFSALLGAPLPAELQTLLGDHVRTRRWFRGKARSIRALEILDQVPLRSSPRELALVLLRVQYAADESETYVLPLAFETVSEPGGATAAGRLFDLRLTQGERRSGVVHDPSGSDELSQLLLELFVRRETPGVNGRVTAQPSDAFASRLAPGQSPLQPHVPSGEQSNTSVFFDQEFMLKVFRQLEPGENPDVELNQFLWAEGYRHVPEPLGSARYERERFTATLGIAQRFVPSEGTAWDVTLEVLQRSFEFARSLDAQRVEVSVPSDDLLDSVQESPPESMEGFLAAYAPFATLLGERTAELHLTLAANEKLEAFKPEPFTVDYQRSIVHATRDRITRAWGLLAEQMAKLPDDAKPLAREVLGCREALESKLDVLDSVRVRASRIRCHGDYHLGQVLYGESDFTILDFEGEPAQPIEMRRLKRSALYDVCGMLRSFHYAATVALQSDRWQAADRSLLAPWSEAWYRWTSAVYLCAYLRKAREQQKPPAFLPSDPAELRALLRLHLIDKCSYELSYELNNRPAWVGVPLAGLLNLAKGA